MRTFASISALLAITLAIAGCGGGSSGCGQVTGGTGSSSSASCNTGTSKGSIPTTLAVTTSAATIAADGSTSATITVVAKDANNALVSGAAVIFTASAGNITAIQATTDTTGTATASLVAGSATAGSTITVTASSGTVSGHTSVTVANTQKTLTLLTSLPQIPSDGSKTAKISALVRDANNNFVTGTAVSFVASSGGLTVTQATTDATGTATATLSSAGDTSNRNITVTAQAGTSTATITVGVIGTKLTLSGPASLVQGSMGTYTVSLTDAGGNGISNQTVALTSSLGNTLAPTTYMTDATGQKTFTMTAVNGGNDTITAAAAGLTATQTVAVSNQSFKFTAPVASANTKVNLGVSAPVTVNWSTAGVLQVGKTVSFSATRGTLSAPSAVTDASGNASVTISSIASGPSVISASAATVTAQSSVDFVATTPASLKAQASPAIIATQGTSTVTVTVRDAQNNLVEGQTVNFSITQDSTGGALSVSSGVTDAQGQASTVYTASTTTSANNGVIISATVQGTAVTGTTSLTVAGQTVFLSLGTGNTVIAYVPPNSPAGTPSVQYELPYSVQAVDNAGHGVNNVPISFTVTSLAYLKGFMVWNGANWQAAPSTSQPTTTSVGPPPVIAPSTDPDAYLVTGIAGCASEDVNNNGILTTGPGGNDYNSNGKLDPGLVAATDIPNATTSNGGSVSLNLIYPKDHAYWVAIRLTATATVAGTQSSTSADFWLPGAAIDYGTKTTAPPGPNSPYGQAPTCKQAN